MPTSEEYEAFESAVARMPYPVFVVDGESHLRALNDPGRALWDEEGLHAELLQRAPNHPFSRLIIRSLAGENDESEIPVLQLRHGTRYEVIQSARSSKGRGRWLMFMLRPFPTPQSIDVSALRQRWSLTPREGDVAAACISGRTTAEICDALAISKETLKTHMARILDKADCENRLQLVAKYLFGD